MAQRIVALLYLVPGLGFCISTLAILAYLDRRGELPMTPFGFRLLGSSIPGMGTEQLTPLGRGLAWLLIGVSAVDAATGLGLWKSGRGGRVGLLTTPVTFILAVLFQLPFLLVVVPLRALLTIVISRQPAASSED